MQPILPPDRSAKPSIRDGAHDGRSLRRYHSLDDFEPVAARVLPRRLLAYVRAGTEREASIRDNRQAFDEIGFVPSLLVDVSGRSTKINIFAHEYSAPFGVAPMGMASLVAMDGDIALAQAADHAKIPMIVSGAALTSIERIVSANPDVWFQAYLSGERSHTAALLARIERSGVHVLVLTVDIPVQANRENFRRKGFGTPLRPSLDLLFDGLSRPRWLFGTCLPTLWAAGMPHFENAGPFRGEPILSSRAVRKIAMRDHFDWAHLNFVREIWPGKLVLKGILSPSDVRTARAHGVDGVILSNHGGRQLDGAVSPMRVLSSCVATADGMPVMMDGGIRRGTDVIKAFALGASMVFVGRPFLYAAAVSGRIGVGHAIDLLTNEVQTDLALLGADRMTSLSPAILRSLCGVRT